MFGLEKQNNDKKRKKFQFDLEIDINKDPKKGKEILQKAETNIHAIKKILREGEKKSEGVKNWETLLEGYSALKVVIQRVVK